MCLVDIVQHMWCTGDILQKLGWTVLVLTPKGSTDTWGTDLLKTLWNVVEALIDTCLRASIHFHDVLQEFRDRRGMETTIM